MKALDAVNWKNCMRLSTDFEYGGFSGGTARFRSFLFVLFFYYFLSLFCQVPMLLMTMFACVIVVPSVATMKLYPPNIRLLLPMLYCPRFDIRIPRCDIEVSRCNFGVSQWGIEFHDVFPHGIATC